MNLMARSETLLITLTTGILGYIFSFTDCFFLVKYNRVYKYVYIYNFQYGGFYSSPTKLIYTSLYSPDSALVCEIYINM